MASTKRNKAAVRKTTARKSPVARAGTRKAASSKVENNHTACTQGNARNVFLAGLGLYGRAIEEALNQIRENRSKLEQSREKAGELFDELVKRGEKVEIDTRKKLQDLELPELKIPEVKLANSEELRRRLDKARDSFNALRKVVSAKSGAA